MISEYVSCCAGHEHLRFFGEKCPACELREEGDRKAAILEEAIMELEEAVESLRQELGI